jgi:hypothetical protein
MKSRLFETALKMQSKNPYSKPLQYYERYDIFLNNNNLFPQTILEIGTYEGDSAKIISKAFERSTILALDLDIKNIDFKEYNNIIYKKADQTKKDQLIPLINEYFPKGIDLVIDDASHIGCYSKLTFDIVFPFLKPGGAYFIEDWGTGYWDSWVDGSSQLKKYNNFMKLLSSHNSGMIGFVKSLISNFQLKKHNNFMKQLPSHNFGMVGFVKSLIDCLGEDQTGKNIYFGENNKSIIEHIEFFAGACMLIKSKND